MDFNRYRALRMTLSPLMGGDSLFVEAGRFSVPDNPVSNSKLPVVQQAEG